MVPLLKVKPLLQLQYFCYRDKQVSGDLLKWCCHTSGKMSNSFERRVFMSAALTLHEALSDLHHCLILNWIYIHLQFFFSLSFSLYNDAAELPYNS